MEGSQGRWPVTLVFLMYTFGHLLGTLSRKVTRIDCRCLGENQIYRLILPQKQREKADKFKNFYTLRHQRAAEAT